MNIFSRVFGIIFAILLLTLSIPLNNFTASADQPGSQSSPYPVYGGWQGAGYYNFVAKNHETGFMNTVCDLNNVNIQLNGNDLGPPYDANQIAACHGNGNNNPPPPPPPPVVSPPPPPAPAQPGSQSNPYPVYNGWQGAAYYYFPAHNNYQAGYITNVCQLNAANVQLTGGNLGSPYDQSQIAACNGPPPISTGIVLPPNTGTLVQNAPYSSSPYTVIFSGSTQPTYGNMANYQRIVVIGNNAYTMGDASDNYVASNNVSLVGGGTDQNAYVNSKGLHLVCCGDQAITVLGTSSTQPTQSIQPQPGSQSNSNGGSSSNPTSVIIRQLVQKGVKISLDELCKTNTMIIDISGLPVPVAGLCSIGSSFVASGAASSVTSNQYSVHNEQCYKPFDQTISNSCYNVYDQSSSANIQIIPVTKTALMDILKGTSDATVGDIICGGASILTVEAADIPGVIICAVVVGTTTEVGSNYLGNGAYNAGQAVGSSLPQNSGSDYSIPSHTITPGTINPNLSYGGTSNPQSSQSGYVVSFSETGLPLGTTWSISLQDIDKTMKTKSETVSSCEPQNNGAPVLCSANTITFTVKPQNYVYQYYVNPPSGYQTNLIAPFEDGTIVNNSQWVNANSDFTTVPISFFPSPQQQSSASGNSAIVQGTINPGTDASGTVLQQQEYAQQSWQQMLKDLLNQQLKSLERP